MTFEELQVLARHVRELETSLDYRQIGPAIEAADVLADALIEAGRLSADDCDRTTIRWSAFDWARENADRRTGRTTRMLQEVLEGARAGKRIIVLGADAAHRDDLARRFAELTPAHDWDAYSRVTFLTDRPTHEWRSARAAGSLVVEDHHTAEVRRRRQALGGNPDPRTRARPSRLQGE